LNLQQQSQATPKRNYGNFRQEPLGQGPDLLTISLISHRQGHLAQHVLDSLERETSQLAKVIVTKNIREPWQPRFNHPTAELMVIDNPAPKGFGANHNAAFAHCETPFFAAVNPDLTFGDTRLTELLTLFEDARVAAVTPAILSPDGERADFVRDLMSLPNLIRRHLGRPAGPAVWFAAICLLLRSEAFRTVKGFDERYYMYCEDADLCARLTLADWRLAVGNFVQVTHDAQRRSLRSIRRLGYHLRGLMNFWGGPVFWAQRRLLAKPGTAQELFRQFD
jgi:N-acetylglucosaminyl-diphospho-decaprenol L-rhamnosyltransferase